MVAWTELLLPILVSAVAVFVISSVIHMVLPIHKSDYGKMPGEGELLAAMRQQSIQPGHYMFPNASSMKELGSPEMLEKFKQGPVGIMTIMPNGVPAMGKNLAMWFALSFLISFTAAYVARLTLAPGADGLVVLRLTTSVAFAGYGYGYLQDSIWKGVPWANSVRGLVDALIYAVVTGVLFRVLWPGA